MPPIRKPAPPLPAAEAARLRAAYGRYAAAIAAVSTQGTAEARTVRMAARGPLVALLGELRAAGWRYASMARALDIDYRQVYEIRRIHRGRPRP
jgi:hypothetical protein